MPFQTNDKLSSFGKCLKKSYPNFDINELKNILKNSKSRRALKKCYSSLSRDHNAIPMNLLVKTLKPTRLISKLPYLDRFYINDRHIIHHRYHCEKLKYNASFLFTGDAKLSVKKYYNQWGKFLENYLRDITFCTLPHHGSEFSFNKDMVKKLPNAFFIAQEYEFENYRNKLGDLILLPKGTNQSYSDMTFEKKMPHYLKENLLAKSLCEKTYENNPNFTKLVTEHHLPFKPHDQFKKADIDARQKLYQTICERIWNSQF